MTVCVYMWMDRSRSKVSFACFMFIMVTGNARLRFWFPIVIVYN